MYKHNNEVMCSLDVISLFTNVALDDTIQICLYKLYALPHAPPLRWSVLEVFFFGNATKKSDFTFDGQYYDQIDDVTISSP